MLILLQLILYTPWAAWRCSGLCCPLTLICHGSFLFGVCLLTKKSTVRTVSPCWFGFPLGALEAQSKSTHYRFIGDSKLAPQEVIVSVRCVGACPGLVSGQGMDLVPLKEIKQLKKNKKTKTKTNECVYCFS